MPEEQQRSQRPVEPFLSRGFVATADELLTLSHFGPSVIIVNGPVGTGKTRLFEYLASIGDDTRLIRIDASLELSDTQILAAILQQLNRYDATIDVAQVRKLLRHAALAKPTAILVDGAEQLTARQLEMLCDLVAPLAAHPEHGLRLLMLTAIPAEKLPWPSGVQQEAIQQYRLAPLQEDELAPFLAHVLALPVEAIHNTYGTRMLRQLYLDSGGWPGKILALLESKALASASNQARLPRQWLIGLGVVFILAGATSSLWWPFVGSSGIEIEKTQPPTHSTKGVRQTREASNHSGGRLTDDSTGDQEIPSEETSETQPKKASTSEIGQAFDADMPPTLETKPESETQHEIVKPVSEDASKMDTISESQAKEGDESPPTTEAEAQPEPKAPAYSEDETWLLSQSPDGFVLQLTGLSHEADMVALLRSLPKVPGKSFRYYRSPFGNGTIYKLVLASFANKSEARAWLGTSAPQAIRRMKPWIKSMSVVHTEIRQAVK